MAYFRIKHQCLNCDSSYIICTQYPEKVKIDTVYCPECGNNGTSIAYAEIAEGDVEDEIPGETPESAYGKNIHEQLIEGSDLRILSLTPEFKKLRKR